MNAHQKTYYQILQIDSGASQSVIDAAYHKLARVYHPDINQDPDTTRCMQELNEAYSVLRDPQQRAAYDQWLVVQAHAASRPHASSAQSHWNGAAPGMPIACQGCGRSDASLRFAAFPYVVSPVFMTFRRGSSGLYCEKCRRQKMANAKQTSFLLGWWSIPWGVFFTLGVLFESNEGQIDPKVNARYLKWLGAYFMSVHNQGEAQKALRASLSFDNDPQVAEMLRSKFERGAAAAGKTAAFAANTWKLWVAIAVGVFVALVILMILVYASF